MIIVIITIDCSLISVTKYKIKKDGQRNLQDTAHIGVIVALTKDLHKTGSLLLLIRLYW